MRERGGADPELAVLSAMAHGRDRDPQRGLRVAVAAMGASVELDPERSRIPAAVRTRVVAASPETLDRWAERFVDAGSLADVFAEG